jgi:hypothetical protein
MDPAVAENVLRSGGALDVEDEKTELVLLAVELLLNDEIVDDSAEEELLRDDSVDDEDSMDDVEAMLLVDDVIVEEIEDSVDDGTSLEAELADEVCEVVEDS